MPGDKITEMTEFLESFPPGTCVRFGHELHRIDSIVFDGMHVQAHTSVARAEHTDAFRYRYECGKGVMFISDLQSATKITREDFARMEDEILSRVSEGMSRMIERMCLLSGAGDRVSSEQLPDLLLGGGRRFFMYQPDADTLRFLETPVNYVGGEVDVYHLVVRVGCLAADVLRLNPGQIADDTHPITEYQFTELKKLIEHTNGQNKDQEEPAVLRRAEQ